MQVHFTPEQEAQLAQMASNEGTDAEHLVKDAALRLLEENARFRVWPRCFQHRCSWSIALFLRRRFISAGCDR